MDLLRSYDPNVACRELRARLLELSRTDRVPHSFESEALLDHATAVLERTRLPRATRLQLLAAAATAFGLCGRSDEGLTLFRRGIEESRSDLEKAEFHYLIALQHYQREGNWREAVREYEEAIARLPAPKATRVNAFLGLVAAYAKLRDGEHARWAAEGARAVNIASTVPHIHLRLGELYSQERDLPGAEREIHHARRLFEAEGNELGILSADAELGTAYLVAGDARRALPILTSVRRRRVALLDLSRVGMAYNNEALARKRLGDLNEARDAYMQALRYHVEAGRKGLCAGTLRNLAGCVANQGEVDLALGLLSEAARHAGECENEMEEFSALGLALNLVLEHRKHLNLAPRLLVRGQALLERAAKTIDRPKLVAFSRQAVQVVALRPRRMPPSDPGPMGMFPSPGTVRAVRKMLEPRGEPGLERTLAHRVRETIVVRGAPSENLIARFLLSWAGLWFVRGDYRDEFDLGQEQSKYQLRRLRDAAIILQQGIRKAARYRLAFHAREGE